MMLKNLIFALTVPRIVWQQCVGKVGTLNVFSVKFPWDVVYQIS